MSNCWSDCCPPLPRINADDELEGSSDSKSGFELYPVRDWGRPAIPEPVAVDWYSGLSLRPESTICDRALTLETKLSCRDREAWMFFVRTSNTSLKFAATSATLPCSSTTTFLLCWPS
jgi:hypothetical protein